MPTTTARRSPSGDAPQQARRRCSFASTSPSISRVGRWALLLFASLSCLGPSSRQRMVWVSADVTPTPQSSAPGLLLLLLPQHGASEATQSSISDQSTATSTCWKGLPFLVREEDGVRRSASAVPEASLRRRWAGSASARRHRTRRASSPRSFWGREAAAMIVRGGGAGEAEEKADDDVASKSSLAGGDEQGNDDDHDDDGAAQDDSNSAASGANDDDDDRTADEAETKSDRAGGAGGDDVDDDAAASAGPQPAISDAADDIEDEGSVTPTAAEEEEEAEGGSTTLNSQEPAEDGSSAVSEAPPDESPEAIMTEAAPAYPILESHDDEDDDGSTSSAYVDRMELADDEGGETTPGGGYEVDAAAPPTTASSSESESAPLNVQEESEASMLAALSEPNAESSQVDAAEEDGPSADTAAATATDPDATPTNAVTDEMKRVLMKELQYRQHEVDRIKPDHARIAIRNKLFRPWEGMPPSWYKDSSPASAQPKSSSPATRRRRLVRQIAISTLLGAAVIQSQVASGRIDPAEIVAVFVAFKDRVIAPPSASSRTAKQRPHTASTLRAPSSTVNQNEDDAPTATSKDSASSRALPAGMAPAARSSTAASTAAAAVSTSSSAPLIAEPLPVNEHVNALGEPHEHSVRPGIPSRPADESELDVTWLDKAITAFERGLRSVFGGSQKSPKRP
jgi:hypothetical protein